VTDQTQHDVRVIEVTIPGSEWAAASGLLRMIIDDERHATGHVELCTIDGRRRWASSDSYRLAHLDGGPDGEDYSILLSPAILHAAEAFMAEADEATLHIEFVDDAPTEVTIKTSNAITTVGIPELPFPATTHMFELEPEEIAATATVRGSALYAFVRSRFSRIDAADDSEAELAHPQYWFGILDGHIHSRIDWHEVGPTRSSLVAKSVEGEAGAPTNPLQLESVIGFFSPDDDIRIVIPRDADRALLFLGTDRRTAVMPLFREMHHARRRVESAIESSVGPLGLTRDSDGDYPLSRDGIDIWGRITPDGQPILLQVFAVVLHDIEPTPELLSELNDLNSNLGFARVFAIEGQVLAEVDLVAETVDAAEVETAIERITDVAVRLAPMLHAMFGGRPAEDPRLGRIERLAQATVTAELEPGRTFTLTGEHADPSWKFDSAVHVVSGWNPQGTARDEDRNVETNALIAADVIRRGGALARSLTTFPDGTQESSLVIWQMSRDDAVEFGRRSNRDAILELDEDAIRVISCADDSIVERPRVV
jgi:hypothetical protein